MHGFGILILNGMDILCYLFIFFHLLLFINAFTCIGHFKHLTFLYLTLPPAAKDSKESPQEIPLQRSSAQTHFE